MCEASVRGAKARATRWKAAQPPSVELLSAVTRQGHTSRGGHRRNAWPALLIGLRGATGTSCLQGEGMEGGVEGSNVPRGRRRKEEQEEEEAKGKEGARY
eukprot:7689556-Pyramimonas_sp.AAC.1